MAFIDIYKRIFSNEEYHQTMADYDAARSQYSDGYQTFLDENGLSDLEDGYEFKKLISDHIDEIAQKQKYHDTVIKDFRSIKKNESRGYKHFLEVHHLTGKSETFKFMEHARLNRSEIDRYDRTYNGYVRIIQNYHTGYMFFLRYNNLQPSNDYSFVEQIAELDMSIPRLDALAKKYPIAVDIYIKNKCKGSLDAKQINALSKVEDDLDINEQYYLKASKIPSTLKIAYQLTSSDRSKFSPTLNEKKKKILEEYDLYTKSKSAKDPEIPDNSALNKKVWEKILPNCIYKSLEEVGQLEIISLISFLYGNKDTIGRATNFISEHKNDIEEYYGLSNRDCPALLELCREIHNNAGLKKFLEDKEGQRALLQEAKRLAKEYVRGYEYYKSSCHYPASDSISLVDANRILANKIAIVSKHEEIEKREYEARQREQRRREEERIKRELSELHSCVSTWVRSTYHDCTYFSMFYYYPVKCSFEVSSSDWDVRRMIWNFKNSPNKTTESDHQAALEVVIPYTEKVLKYFFGSKVSMLAFMCVPASTKAKNDRRFKEFAEKVCRDLGMYNANTNVTYVKDGISKLVSEDGIDIPPELEFNQYWLKGKYIILFDDVITSGGSMERMKRQLERIGAYVIGSISIGKTKHEYVNGQEPIWPIIRHFS